MKIWTSRKMISQFNTKSLRHMLDVFIPGHQSLERLVKRRDSKLAIYDFGSAQQADLEIRRRWPQHRESIFGAARISSRKGELLEAERHWLKALECFPDEFDPLIGLAQVLLRIGERERANEVFTRLLERFPGKPEGFIGCARVQLRSGNFVAGQEYVIAGLDTFPFNAELNALMALFFVELDQRFELRRFIKKLPSSILDDANFRYAALFRVYDYLGCTAEYLKLTDEVLAGRKNLRAVEAYSLHLRRRHEYHRLVEYLETEVQEFPYSFQLQELLAAGYHRSNRPEKLKQLKLKMRATFGDSLYFPFILGLGFRHLDQDFDDLLKWLSTDRGARRLHGGTVLDSLLLAADTGKAQRVMEVLPGSSSTEQLRLVGLQCQILDLDLQKESKTREVRWLQFKDNRRRLNARISDIIGAVRADEKEFSYIAEHMSEYLCRLSQFPEAYIYSRESYYDASMVALGLADCIVQKKPASLIRLGDGEGTFLPYAPDIADMRHLDQKNIQHVWWGKSLISSLDAEDIASSLKSSIHSADFIGIPPPWRLLVEYLRPGGLELSDRSKRGNKAVVDYILEGKLSRDQVPVSSAIANDLYYWSLYRQIFSRCSSLSFVSCHNLSAELQRRYGLSTRLAIIIPAESAYGSMFDVESGGARTVNDIFPRRHQEILSALAPLPGEVFLVAAGILGKIYCEKIKRSGGIAIDIGSVADYWMGYQTRRYKADQNSYDPEKTFLIDSPFAAIYRTAEGS